MALTTRTLGVGAHKETSVVSAATCNIGSATTLKVAITGAVTITSLGTTANAIRFIRFAAALVLTYNATSLVLPGKKNILTAAGDTALAVSDATGNWTVINYTRVSAPVDAWVPVVKSADQSKTADTALAADTELKIAMAANEKRLIRGVINWTAGATEDFKIDFNGPASPTLVVIKKTYNAPGTTTIVAGNDTAYNVSYAMPGAAGSGTFYLDAYLVNGPTAGDFEFRWAQNVSGATAAVVLAGSYLESRVV
jgi:hypothetical protein